MSASLVSDGQKVVVEEINCNQQGDESRLTEKISVIGQENKMTETAAELNVVTEGESGKDPEHV